ncbi:MAG: hypothetical protein C0516_01985 [Gemmatimonas sp.]|nr:hypothetical protein [Gemmatimonas sp.]
MHRIWMGNDPQVIMGALGAFLACLALIIHVWAYSITGWPKYKKMEYAAKAPPASVR